MREDRARTHSAPLSIDATSQSPIGFFVPDRDEQLSKALAKQKEVMLAKILYEREKHEDAKAMKAGEYRHLSAMRNARREAADLIRRSSAQREIRRTKILEKAALDKVKEDEDYFQWKRSLKRRNQEVMNRTFTDSLASQRSALQTAKRQREYEETKLQKQESEHMIILDKMKRYEDKMQRHDSLHKDAMKSITDKITAKVQRVKQVTQTIEAIREIDGIKKVKRLIDKHQTNSRRRENRNRRWQAKLIEHKRTQSDKRRQIVDRVKKVESEIRSKSQFLEHRMQTSEHVLQKKFQTWNKDLAIRHEHSKLKNEDTLEAAERRKRIEGVRRMQILEKHLKDSQRLEELKQARSLMSSQSRDIQFKATQERDRLRSALGFVAKSPESARTKEIIREAEGRQTK